jgi:hypothetical protein
MFFRRERPKVPTAQERLDQLKARGFTVLQSAGGGFRITRGACAVDLTQTEGNLQIAERPGILLGGEIARLVDAGYQKIFRAASGKTKPALAEDLRALHDFEEDLKEALGQTSLYNESLGTVSTFYLYDRVQDRDRGVPKRAWE